MSSSASTVADDIVMYQWEINNLDEERIFHYTYSLYNVRRKTIIQVYVVWLKICITYNIILSSTEKTFLQDFLGNSEAFASKLLENSEEMLPSLIITK